jgi:hypothetical protein
MSPIVVGLDSGRSKLFNETGPPPLRGPLEFRPAPLVRVRHLSMRFFASRLNGVDQLISLEMVTSWKLPEVEDSERTDSTGPGLPHGNHPP